MCIRDRDEAALKVLHSGNYILGEEVTEFEKEFANYCGVKYAVGVGNGTDALIIALQACGIKPGDEVITCAMSFFATAEAIGIVGATPVFVDCKKDTFVIDSAKIEEKITNKTKAIIPIHLYGQCAETVSYTHLDVYKRQGVCRMTCNYSIIIQRMYLLKYL